MKQKHPAIETNWKELVKQKVDCFTFSTHIEERHLERYFEAILEKEKYIEQHSVPYFSEEIEVDYLALRENHVNFYSDLSKIAPDQQTEALCTFLKSVTIQDFLVLIGQRFTPGSVKDVMALPPPNDELIHAFLKPHNEQVSKGVRAWEKHVGRSGSFWGHINGSPKEKAAAALNKLYELLSSHTWWNVYGHFKHDRVYEIRNKEGYGLRWQLEPLTFIGMVEPFELG
jgi:hypothetical protein